MQIRVTMNPGCGYHFHRDRQDVARPHRDLVELLEAAGGCTTSKIAHHADRLFRGRLDESNGPR